MTRSVSSHEGNGAAATAFVGALLLAALSGCGGSYPGESTPAGTVLTSAQMEINGVGQGMTEAEVSAVLGPPLARVVPFYAFMSDDSMVLWRYPGLRIEFVDQVVDRLVCTSHCATTDSIRIGDSTAKVIRTYGRPETLARPFGGMLIYHHAEVPCTMTFGLRGRVIGRIEVACEEED